MSPEPSHFNIDGYQYENFDNQHAGDIHGRDDVKGEVAFKERCASVSVSDANQNTDLVCCRHQFKTKSALTRHRRESCRAAERNSKEYRCDHCGKLFTRPCNVKQHLRRLGWSPRDADNVVRARYGAKMRFRRRLQDPSHE